MRFFWPFLFAISLAATMNEPLRFELLSGYRNDRLHWHLQEGGTGLLTYSERYRDVGFWENGLSLKAIHRDLAFFLCGSYAAFGKGSLFQRYSDLPFTAQQPQFRFDTDGWAADASGRFSYAVNLTADRTYKTILLPLVGYSAHFEQIRRSGSRPNPLESTDAVGATSFAMQSFLPGRLHSAWYGFFVGVGFMIEPGNRLIFNGGYSYHWLNIRFRTQFRKTVSLFDHNLVSQQETFWFFRTKGNGNIGQTGWAQIDCVISNLWRVGFGTQIHYFSSTLLETNLHSQTISIQPAAAPAASTISQKLKVRWTPISGWFMVSREL